MRVLFYTTTSGRCPVREYLQRLNKEDRASIGEVLHQFERFGFNILGIEFRQIERKLWEMKIDRHKIFYFCLGLDEVVLLHAYKKQGQRLPRKERKIALKQMKEYL